MSFQNLKLRILAPDKLETLSEQLLQFGALAVTFEDAMDEEPIFEPLPNEVIFWQDTILSALFPHDMNLQILIEALEEADGIQVCSQETVPDNDWQKVLEDTWQPMCFYERTIPRSSGENSNEPLWICPSFCDAKELKGKVVRLDPGLAFGTGTHPTTSLCLDWLATNPPKNQCVIDYGCGSGILGVAALILGAEKVYAVDHDPQALQATRSNADLNDIDPARLLVLLPEESLPQADLLLANILAKPLIELASYFVHLLKPRGAFILSGILGDQAQWVQAAYSPYSDEMKIVEKEGWVMIFGRTKPGAK
jgi:ribosomal protein L11 methyltransferase